MDDFEIVNKLIIHPEHQKWPKIKRLTTLRMVITEKMDGTNAQIHFDDEGFFYVGSRNRWLYEDEDNFGFYKWVMENHKELFQILGPGRHYGEWAGKGIQHGYGMADRKFFSFHTSLSLFDTKLVQPVPVMYAGEFRTLEPVYDCIEYLRKNGSIAVPGCMNPEGVIVNVGGTRYKAYCDPLNLGGKNNDTM